MNNWSRRAEAAGTRAMRVSYEKLKSAPQQTFAELFQFMGLPFSADDIRRAVEDCVFERLQMRERAASGANPWLARGDPGNPEFVQVSRRS